MTYREKLIKDHPEWDTNDVDIIMEEECPENNHGYCDGRCDKCWNAEIQEGTAEEKESPIKNNEISCDSCIHSEVCKFRADFIKALDIAKGAPDMFEVIIRCKYNL